jgi:hypothetical protein
MLRYLLAGNCVNTNLSVAEQFAGVRESPQFVPKLGPGRPVLPESRSLLRELAKGPPYQQARKRTDDGVESRGDVAPLEPLHVNLTKTVDPQQISDLKKRKRKGVPMIHTFVVPSTVSAILIRETSMKALHSGQEVAEPPADVHEVRSGHPEHPAVAEDTPTFAQKLSRVFDMFHAFLRDDDVEAVVVERQPLIHVGADGLVAFPRESFGEQVCRCHLVTRGVEEAAQVPIASLKVENTARPCRSPDPIEKEAID